MPVTTKSTTMFSLDTVKAYLAAAAAGGVPTGDTSQDTFLAQIADAVSEKFEQRTKRYITTRDGIIDTWNGDGRRHHFLSRMDVSALTSLTICGSPVDVSTVYLDNHLGLIQLTDRSSQGWFPFGLANVVAVFTAGLDAQDGVNLPSDVVEACLEWVKAIYDEKRSGATSATQIDIGPAHLILKPGLGFNIQQTLTDWRDLRA